MIHKSPRLLAVFLCSLPVAASADQTWYEAPSVSIMTGFIYEPLKPYTIDQWKKDLGSHFDADRWARDFKEAGAQHLVFYDKWIDGLVFHDTKTTGFKTDRDFVRELAAACQKHKLPLVFYFNAVSDGNPEFDEWSLLDRQGRPIVFGARWPTRYQTLHSPFRQKALQQVRELLTDYGPIHGIWHDIFRERLHTSSKWTAQGFQKMYGEKFDEATPAQLAEFNARTLGSWLEQVEAIRRETKQEHCIYTANGSGGNFLPAGVWTHEVGSQLHYLFNEGHGFARNDQLAQMAWVLPKPLEINLLLNSTWFTPMSDTPPPPKYTQKQVIAATAIVVCQGGSVHFALTPGHSGRFGEDLQQAKVAGAWFGEMLPHLMGAEPYADAAIVLGTPAADGPGLHPQTWGHAVALSDALGRAGFFSRFLYDTPHGGNWPASLEALPAVLVPESAMLDEVHLEQLRQYVKRGGRLIAFGRATMLDGNGQSREEYALGDVLGVRYKGAVTLPNKRPAGTQVTADSEYSPEFAAAHLIDGRPTAWASGEGRPMPHWAEITLPAPADVAAVELTSRQGPYLVVDFDVEAEVDGEREPVATVRDAKTRRISARLKQPVRTRTIRVTVRRELYQGQDRQYADVESIRVIDTAGRDCSTCATTGAPLVVTAADPQKARGLQSVLFPLTLADVEPTTAELLGRIGDPQGPPAVLWNRCGGGEAILIGAPADSFKGQEPFFTALGRLAAGRPTLSVSAKDHQRYRFILTQLFDHHVLHVIDPVTAGANFQPGEVQVSLMADRLGAITEARLVGAAKPLPMRQEDGQITFTVRPDPVASVLLR